jgi:4-amino-4-deoxy-L-arabinose transferase-like glycosyltransferase
MMNTFRNRLTVHFFLLLLILLVATANRFYGLDRLSLWADELWVVMASSKGSLVDMLGFVYWQDNHPPGHYLFTRYWQMLAGDSDFAIRFPFAVSGIFLVYSTYVIGKKYYSAEAGLIAATLVSSSWQMIYYSQEARANIMVAVTALWSLHYFYRFVFEQPPRRIEAASPFWLVATMTAYLHYAGTVFIGSLGLLWLLLSLAKRDAVLWRTGLLMFAPVLVLYLPWAGATFYRLTHTPPGAWWQRPEWNYLYENFKWIFGFGSRILWLYQASALLLVLLAALALMQQARAARKLSDRFAFVTVNAGNALAFSACALFMIVVPVMIFFLKSRVSQPVYDYRHFVYTFTLLALPTGFLLSLPLFQLEAGKRMLVLSLLVMMLLLTQNYYNILGKLYTGPHFKAEYRQSVDLLVSFHRKYPQEQPLIASNSVFYNHYLERNFSGHTADYLLASPSQMDDLMAFVDKAHHEVIYLLESPERGGNGMISLLDMAMAKRFTPQCRTHFIYTQVIRFIAVPPPDDIDWDQVPDCQ